MDVKKIKIYNNIYIKLQKSIAMRIKKKYFIYILALIVFTVSILYIGRISHYYTGTFMINYGTQRKSMLERQTLQAKQCDILIMGDSLVEGMFIHNKEKNIFLMGIGGSKIEDWTVWAPQLLKNIKANVLIIALGVNNSARDRTFNEKEFINNFRKICELATAQGIPRIILSSVLPVGKNQTLGHKTFNNDTIKKINNALKKLTDNTPYKYLDCYSHFVNEEGFMPENLTTDGVHLNEKGYQLWKKLLLGNL